MTVLKKHSIESRYGWWVAIASTLMITVAFGSTYLVIVGLKPIAAEFSWPRQIPSAGYSAVLLGGGIGGILIGLWSDRRGMAGPALSGALFVGLGLIMISYSTTMFTFLGAHFLILGLLGNGAMFSPLLTNVTHWFDRRMGIAVAVVSGGQSLAGAIWPPVFRYAMEQYGWRDTMFAYGIVCFAVLIPLSLVMRRPSPRMVKHGSIRNRELRAESLLQQQELVLGLKSRTVFTMLCIAIIGCCVAMSMPMVHIVSYCSDLGLSAARGAEMLSILLLCAFLSRLVYGWLSDRVGGLRTLLLGSALQLLGLAFFMYAKTLEELYIVSIFYGLGYGGIVPMYAIIIRQLFPDTQAGWRIGVIFLFGTAGMAIGGYLGGLIFDLTATYRLAFLTGISFNLLNLGLILYLVRRLRYGDGGTRRFVAANI